MNQMFFKCPFLQSKAKAAVRLSLTQLYTSCSAQVDLNTPQVVTLCVCVCTLCSWKINDT